MRPVPTRIPFLGFLLPFLARVPAAAAGASYDMVKEYYGPTFFDEWTFYDNYDNLTNGDVIFLSKDKARSSKLASVDASTNRAILRVDNSTSVSNGSKRNSVRLQTDVRYAVGSLWIADFTYVPYGCSVWPAWWAHAPEWPDGGEIDTFEGVNLAPRSQMALHTLPGCTVTGAQQTSQLVNSTDCSYQANDNLGCVVTNPKEESYGEAFAAAGGGVFVTEFATSGISVWFFPRASVPSTISSNSSSIDTSSLGTPVANWPSTTCSSSQFFHPQNLIFTITLCGDFAGADNIFTQTCNGVCYTDYVLGNGANYDTAYFEINSVRVFSASGTNTIVRDDPTSAAGRPGPVLILSTMTYAFLALALGFLSL